MLPYSEIVVDLLQGLEYNLVLKLLLTETDLEADVDHLTD